MGGEWTLDLFTRSTSRIILTVSSLHFLAPIFLHIRDKKHEFFSEPFRCKILAYPVVAYSVPFIYLDDLAVRNLHPIPAKSGRPEHGLNLKFSLHIHHTPTSSLHIFSRLDQHYSLPLSGLGSEMDASGPRHKPLAPLPAAGVPRAASPDHYPAKRRVACTECRQGKVTGRL